MKKIAIIGIILLSVLLLGCTNPFEQKQPTATPTAEPTELKKIALDNSDLDAVILDKNDLPGGYESNPAASGFGPPSGLKYEKMLGYSPKDSKNTEVIFSDIMIFEKGDEYPFCSVKYILGKVGTSTNASYGAKASYKRIENVGEEAGMLLLEQNGTIQKILAQGYYSNAYFEISLLRLGTGTTEQEVIKYMQSISKKLKERCPNCAPNPRKCTSINTTA